MSKFAGESDYLTHSSPTIPIMETLITTHPVGMYPPVDIFPRKANRLSKPLASAMVRTVKPAPPKPDLLLGLARAVAQVNAHKRGEIALPDASQLFDEF